MASEFLELTIVAVIIHSVFTCLGSILGFKRGDGRARQIWYLGMLDAGLFGTVAFVLMTLRYPSSLLDEFTILTYAVVISFVFSIEIPGYLILDTYDGDVIDRLNDLRIDLLDLRLSTSFATPFSKLKDTVNKNQPILSSLDVWPLIQKLMGLSEQTKNLNPTLGEIILNELTTNINDISNRTKHPIPKLIDILSLAGLSFLIAQVLKYLG